jgi:hypothetical protein
MPAKNLANSWKMATSAYLPAIPINPARAKCSGNKSTACDTDAAFETFATDLMEYVGLRVEDLGDRRYLFKPEYGTNGQPARA